MSRRLPAVTLWLALGACSCAAVEEPETRRAGERSRPLPGQIVADPDHPSWFRRQGGGPFFLCGPGDPEDFLYRGTRRPDGTREGDQWAILEGLAPTGANSLYLMAVRSHGGDGPPDHNPFAGGDPGAGLDPRILDQWESWFAEMDRLGITMVFFVYDDGADPWRTGRRVGAAETAFVTRLVERFQHHRHLIWAVAEEYSEALPRERVAALARLIRRADHHDHPVAVHKRVGLSFADFAGEGAVDQFALQWVEASAPDLHAAVVRAWRLARGRYNLTLAESPGWGTGAEGRRKLWAAALGGAYVLVLGWDVVSTPPADLAACGHLVRFLEATELAALAPRPDLALGGTEFVLADPGRSYVAYGSRGGPLGLAGVAAGRWRLTWLDPATGRTVEQGDLTLPAGDARLSPPAGFGDEVALHLRRR